MAATINWLGLSVVLIVLAASTTVSTLRCYVCNTDDNTECLELPKNFTEEEYRDNRTIPGRLLEECPDDEQGRKPHCRVQFLQVLGGSVADHLRLWRECGYEPQPTPCYKFSNGGHKERVCQCFTDGCNSEARPPPTLAEILFANN